METGKFIFLDAMSKDEEQRMTAFGDSPLELINDFSQWMKEYSYSSSDIKYADFFTPRKGKKVPDHIASLVVNENQGFDFKATPGSRLNPFKRNRGITAWFRRLVGLC